MRPPALVPDGPFRARTALTFGVPAHELRQDWWDVPFTGVRSPAGLDLDTLGRCLACATVLPDGAAFGHVTALRLHEVELPWRLDPGLGVADGVDEPEPLHVVLPSRAARPRRRDVVAHFTGQHVFDVVMLDGVAVTSPAQTWLHLASRLTVDELVVLGDAMTRRKAPATTVERLRLLTASTFKMRGIVRCREALELIRAGTDSSMESRTRLVLVRAGLPCPEVNQKQHDDGGRFLARTDLAFPGLKIAVEYDGDVHRTDPATWRRDVERRQRLEEDGWLIITVTADDVLRHPERLVARVRRAIRDRRHLLPRP